MVLLLFGWWSFFSVLVAQGQQQEQQCQKQLSQLLGHPLVAVPLEFAQHFQHFQAQKWHYLTHQHGQLLIGPPVPGQLPCQILHLTAPLQRSITLSSAHLPFFVQLKLIDRLIGMSKVGSVASSAVANIREVGYPPPPELLLALNPDSLLMFHAPLFLQDLEKFGRFLAPKIILLEHQESHPLARLEWIKFFGLLYGEWERSKEIFRSIKAEYLTWSQRARFSAKRPQVLVGSLAGPKWDAPAGNSYFAHLLADAGGDYLWEKFTATQLAKLTLEQVQQLSPRAVVWITLNSWKSKQEILLADAHYFNLRAFGENRIFNFSIAVQPGPGQVSWEEALGRPDKVLKDLIFILHPEYLIEHQFYWARKLD